MLLRGFGDWMGIDKKNNSVSAVFFSMYSSLPFSPTIHSAIVFILINTVSDNGP